MSICFCCDEISREPYQLVVILQLPIGNQHQQSGLLFHALILTTERTYELR